MATIPPEVTKFLAMAAIPVVGAVLGAVLLRRGLRARRRSKAVANATEASVGDLSPGDGVVRVTGSARPVGDTVAAELVGTEAVLVHTTVESDRRSDHETTRAVPFDLDDGTGRVRVDLPEEAEIRLRTDAATRVSHDATTASVGGPSEDLPEGVRTYVETHDVAPVGTRSYSQGAVVPGESVSVVGEAVEGPTGFDAPDVTITGDPDAVVASNREDVDEVLDTEWMALVVLGTAMVVAGGTLSVGLAVAIL